MAAPSGFMRTSLWIGMDNKNETFQNATIAAIRRYISKYIIVSLFYFVDQRIRLVLFGVQTCASDYYAAEMIQYAIQKGNQIHLNTKHDCL